MNNPDTEILFPMRAIPSLAECRSEKWKLLVNEVASLGNNDPKKIAFSSMMIKLAGCMGCSADSFRALRGCTQCSIQVVKRYKGSDDDLERLYSDTTAEIKKVLEKREKLVLKLE
jgi:hypothetical protein